MKNSHNQDPLTHEIIGAAIEVHRALVLACWKSYMKLMSLKKGLLINFNVRFLREGIKRVFL